MNTEKLVEALSYGAMSAAAYLIFDAIWPIPYEQDSVISRAWAKRRRKPEPEND